MIHTFTPIQCQDLTNDLIDYDYKFLSLLLIEKKPTLPPFKKKQGSRKKLYNGNKHDMMGEKQK